MTKLSLNEVKDKVIAAGVKYIPAAKYFYSDFPFKIELSPRFRGLGKTNGKRGCQIDISNPVKARHDLLQFNEKIEKLIHNVEHRTEIQAFVAGLSNVRYKARAGGENSIFYFVDPAIVLLIVGQYADVIASVTGPISKDHERTINASTVRLRDDLYFHKFRYYLEVAASPEFFEDMAMNVGQLLDGMDPLTYRQKNLDNLIRHFNQPAWPVPGLTTAPPNSKYIRRPKSVIIYLSDPEDYVLLKLLAGEYLRNSFEIKLFSELSPDN
jgi:hypothetical protein